jgi:hypothetical protein
MQEFKGNEYITGMAAANRLLFHGIVPGIANHPLGRIELNVCFRDSGNFQREKLEFEVMDWPSQYHTILGRPTFARFMAVPHYAHLTLKIPSPKGVIIVKGSFKVSDTCDKEFNRMAQTFGRCGDPAYHCMCSMQVVDITQMKHCLTSITSLRVVQ